MAVEFDPSPIATQMIYAHRAIARGLDASLGWGAALAGLDPADTVDSRSRLAGYVEVLIGEIGAHHADEESQVFSVLQPLIAAIPYDRLIEDHRVMVPHLQDAAMALHDYRDSHGWVLVNGSLQNLLGSLAAVQALSEPHHDLEERSMCASVLNGVLSRATQRLIVWQWQWGGAREDYN